MRKLLVLFALCAALSSHAAPRKLATVQVADAMSCVSAVVKLGELSGMAMIGPMLSPMIVRNPVTEFFGPMREGASALLLVCVPEGQDLAPSNLLENADVALVYPLMRTKAQFLAAHPGAVETNGLIVAKGKDSGKKYYSAFSKDGKWVASSEVAAFVLPALNEIPAAEKPMDGDVVRVFSTEIKRLSAAVAVGENEKKLSETDKLVLATYQKILKDVESIELGLRIDSRGLDVRGRAVMRKGSDFANTGKTTLGKNPFDFAAPEALSAEALAAGCLSRPAAQNWETVRKLLVKYGIRVDSVSVTEKDGVASTTVDLVRLLKDTKEFVETCKDKKKPVDADGLCRELSTNETLFALKKLDSPQRGQSFLKGTKATVSPSVRYAETLPELVGKPVFYATCCSMYEILRAAVPQVVEVFGEGDETLQMLKPMFAALPPPGKGGTASAAWRDGEALRGQLRISKDEFKSLAAFYQMAQMSMMSARAKDAKNAKVPAADADDGDFEGNDED